jgi:hypothetical protein
MLLTPALPGVTYVNVNYIYTREDRMTEVVETLDDLGRWAWLTVMVVGFVLFWPIGLAVLAYMIWSGRMGCGRFRDASAWQQRMAERWERKRQRWGREGGPFGGAYSGTGNRAFDEYRQDTLNRLEQEAREFREFLGRLRTAKDKAEFDQFMAERRAHDAGGPAGGQATG